MSEKRKDRRERDKYIQYVYHFKYPFNSIDVRTVDSGLIDLMRELYDLNNSTPWDSWVGSLINVQKKCNKLGIEPTHITVTDNYVDRDLINQIEQMFQDHYPEYLV